MNRSLAHNDPGVNIIARWPQEDLVRIRDLIQVRFRRMFIPLDMERLLVLVDVYDLRKPGRRALSAIVTSENYNVPEVIGDDCGRRKFGQVVGEIARWSFPICVCLHNDAVAYLNHRGISAAVGQQYKPANNATS